MTIPPVPPAAVSPAEPAEAEAPKRASWWRMNRASLAVLAVVVPVIVLGVGGYGWWLQYGFGAVPISPVVVADDESIDYGGATWGPIKSIEVTDTTGFVMPGDGARLIAVGIPLDVQPDPDAESPDSAGIYCAIPTLVEQSTGREWRSSRADLGLLYSADEPEQCTSDRTGEYQVIVPFVIPDDAEGPFWVDVVPQDAGGEFLRFSVDP